MAELLENEIDWFVCFADGGRWHIWDLFTSKGYRHCFAFRWDGFNWVLVDPLGSWLEVQVMPYTHEDNVPEKMLELGHKVLYVRKNRDNKFIFRGVMTCVNIIKHLIGVRAFWIVTPRKLYNYLRRENHGIPITKRTRTERVTIESGSTERS